jgi:hypothetical protein
MNYEALFFYLLGSIAFVNTWFSFRSICVAWTIFRDVKFNTGAKVLMLFSSALYPLTNLFIGIISYLTADMPVISFWALTSILIGHTLLHYGLMYCFLFEEENRDLNNVTERPV